MSDKSNIEWTDATWNPIRGCSRVSEGCRGCYAERVAARFADDEQAYAGLAHYVKRQDGTREARWTGELTFGHNLDQPLTWRRPRHIFVNSMSDLFHEKLSIDEIATVFAICVAAHHLNGHILQILTKRSVRLFGILHKPEFWEQVNIEAGLHVMEGTDPLARRSDDARATLEEYGPDNPPPGIWLGVSVENQEAADDRIPDLLGTPAAKRFISAEPLLGTIDLDSSLGGTQWIGGQRGCEGTHCGAGTPDCPKEPHHHHDERCNRGLDWVIVGGESGPKARPMHPDWARTLRDQCQAAGVPFFFKQWGEWARLTSDIIGPNGSVKTSPRGSVNWRAYQPDSIGGMFRVGKKAAGRLLDGRTWDEVPA